MRWRNLPTAAVVIRSWPWPTWSACAFVRSSNIVSLASENRGKYCRLRNSFIRVLFRVNHGLEFIYVHIYNHNGYNGLIYLLTVAFSLVFLWVQLLERAAHPVEPIKLARHLIIVDPFVLSISLPRASSIKRNSQTSMNFAHSAFSEVLNWIWIVIEEH